METETGRGAAERYKPYDRICAIVVASVIAGFHLFPALSESRYGQLYYRSFPARRAGDSEVSFFYDGRSCGWIGRTPHGIRCRRMRLVWVPFGLRQSRLRAFRCHLRALWSFWTGARRRT